MGNCWGRAEHIIQANSDILTINNLSKTFVKNANRVEQYLFKDATFSIPKGSIVALTGENGTGKTTIFNVINGLEPPSSGQIHYFKENITLMSLEDRVELGIGRMFQENHIFPNMTISENLLIGINVHDGANNKRHFAWHFSNERGNKSNDKAKYLAKTVLGGSIVDEMDYKLAGNLSYGQKRRLGLARLFMREYNLLLLDEPTAGIDIGEVENFIEIIKSLRDQSGCTILFIEHDEKVIRRLADSVLLIKDHQILAINKSDKIEDETPLPAKLFEPVQDKTSTEILGINKLSSKYPGESRNDESDSWVLNDISMRITANDFILLTGKNGSGKTTLVKSILNLGPIRSSETEIKFMSKYIKKLSTWEISRLGISYLVQGGKLFPSLTVKENVTIAFLGDDIKCAKVLNCIEEIITKPSSIRSDQLSTGERHLVAFVISIELNNSLLILDEPVAGIAEKNRKYIFSKLTQKISENEFTCLVIDHTGSDIIKLANRHIELDRREIVRNDYFKKK